MDGYTPGTHRILHTLTEGSNQQPCLKVMSAVIWHHMLYAMSHLWNSWLASEGALCVFYS